MSDSERQTLVALRHLAQCLEQREKASRVGHTTCVLWVGEVDIAARELQKAIDTQLSNKRDTKPPAGGSTASFCQRVL
jgi:hypothetical protein